MIFTTRSILGFEDKIPFGKYKGEKVCIIMAKDLKYIRYLYNKGVLFDDHIRSCLKSIKSK